VGSFVISQSTGTKFTTLFLPERNAGNTLRKRLNRHRYSRKIKLFFGCIACLVNPTIQFNNFLIFCVQIQIHQILAGSSADLNLFTHAKTFE